MKLSVAMIVKNEEECIATCLNSIADADEVVVLDTGSTDKTAEVITSLSMPNVRHVIGEYKWHDDFSDARNTAISRCTGDWCLIIDADETLERDGLRKIRAAIDEGANQRTLSCSCILNGSGERFNSVRVFKLNADIRYTGVIHETLNANDGGNPVAAIRVGSSPAHKLDPFLDLRILQSQLSMNPDDTRTLYYLAREHYYHKDDDQAVEMFGRYVKKSVFIGERADAYLYLARIHWRNRRGDDARTACMNAITINSDFKEALLFMAELSFEHNAIRWRDFAKHATNERVLFVRAA